MDEIEKNVSDALALLRPFITFPLTHPQDNTNRPINKAFYLLSTALMSLHFRKAELETSVYMLKGVQSQK